LKRCHTEFWIMHGVVKINICIEIETHGNYRLIHGLFHIDLVISTRPWYRPPRDDISRGLMTRAIWKRPCINIFITYFARTDNMLLPFTRGHIPCYCPRKMLLPRRRQITRRKLCFYYTCKFGVISIKYVITCYNSTYSGGA
jgi:hypothetical protein